MKKLFAATLLTLCVGVHALEVSGHWDRTFQDANDEAGVVAIVLCIGVALSVAGTLVKHLLARIPARLTIAPSLGSVRLAPLHLAIPVCISGPPLVPLRI